MKLHIFIVYGQFWISQDTWPQRLKTAFPTVNYVPPGDLLTTWYIMCHFITQAVKRVPRNLTSHEISYHWFWPNALFSMPRFNSFIKLPFRHDDKFVRSLCPLSGGFIPLLLWRTSVVRMIKTSRPRRLVKILGSPETNCLSTTSGRRMTPDPIMYRLEYTRIPKLLRGTVRQALHIIPPRMPIQFFTGILILSYFLFLMVRCKLLLDIPGIPIPTWLFPFYLTSALWRYIDKSTILAIIDGELNIYWEVTYTSPHRSTSSCHGKGRVDTSPIGPLGWVIRFEKYSSQETPRPAHTSILDDFAINTTISTSSR